MSLFTLAVCTPPSSLFPLWYTPNVTRSGTRQDRPVMARIFIILLGTITLQLIQETMIKSTLVITPLETEAGVG